MELFLSEGEILDRLSILELKKARIADPVRRCEVDKELELYGPIIPMKQKHILYYTLLFHVNEWIWDMTDVIKKHTELDQLYAKRAYHIFEWNQSRFRIKTILNRLANATIQEQKSYHKQEIRLRLPEGLSHIDLFCLLCYLILSYDHVSINTYNTCNQWIFSVFPSIHQDSSVEETKTIHIPNQEMDSFKMIFESLKIEDKIQDIVSVFHANGAI